VLSNEVEPMQPFALIGLDQGSRLRRELSPERLVSRGDGAIERSELWVGTDSMLPWRLCELAVEALRGGDRTAPKGENREVCQTHSDPNSISPRSSGL